MAIKKTIITTSRIIISALLVSQMFSFANSRIKPKTINYSAFVNLIENTKNLTSAPVIELATQSEDITITNDIIKLIEKDINREIRKSRLAIISKQIIKEAVEKNNFQSIASEKTNEDLKSYEINNKELIELYALPVDHVEYSEFKSVTLNSTYNDVIKDEVVLGQASTDVSLAAPIEADEVKTIQPATTREDIKDEDMVMFDYSDKKEPEAKASQPMDQKLYERPLSASVKEAISREMTTLPKGPMPKLNTQKEEPQKETIDLNSEDNIVYDYTNHNELAKEQQQHQDSVTSAFSAPADTRETNFVLSAKEIHLDTQKTKKAYSFEFVPDYNRSERVSDQSGGEIAFGYSLAGEMNTQTGVVSAQGMIPTRVELNLGLKNGIDVPLISDEGIQKFLQKKAISIEGNLVLLALNSQIIDTEIDSPNAERFYFDQNFKSMNAINGASFVLYAGVRSGNMLVRYLLNNKESAQKIIYVGDGEMYFEDASFIAAQRETYSFTTRTLLGQKKKELVIDENLISFVNTKNTSKKKALNAYEIRTPNLVSGMRKYLNFKHLSENILVGTWNEKEIEIPSNDFIARILEKNQINSLKERCVVQINLSKDLSEVHANGKNNAGEMYVETSYLDKDGNFSADNLEMAEKTFILGDLEGQFNIKLDYKDGSTEFLKTFCTQGTYLVEQL